MHEDVGWDGGSEHGNVEKWIDKLHLHLANSLLIQHSTPDHHFPWNLLWPFFYQPAQTPNNLRIPVQAKRFILICIIYLQCYIKLICVFVSRIKFMITESKNLVLPEFVPGSSTVLGTKEKFSNLKNSFSSKMHKHFN